jgi:hypothetical protein
MVKVFAGALTSLVMLVPVNSCEQGEVHDYRSPETKSKPYPRVQQHDWCYPCFPSHKTKKYKDSLKHDNGGDYCILGRRIYSNKKC